MTISVAASPKRSGAAKLFPEVMWHNLKLVEHRAFPTGVVVLYCLAAALECRAHERIGGECRKKELIQ